MFSEWSQEGLDLAISTVYEGMCLESSFYLLFCVFAGFEPNSEPTEEYKAKALPKIEERMMYGGRRLAELIKDIYTKPSAEVEVFLNWIIQLPESKNPCEIISYSIT